MEEIIVCLLFKLIKKLDTFTIFGFNTVIMYEILLLGPPSPLIWPVQPNSSSPSDETNVKLTPKEPTRR